jgi:hypothetical protein
VPLVKTDLQNNKITDESSHFCPANNWAPLTEDEKDSDNKDDATTAYVVDSAATSHFVRNKDKLPKIGISDKLVALPNGQIIQATQS